MCLKLDKYLKIDFHLVSGMLVVNYDCEDIISGSYICSSGSLNGVFSEFVYNKACYVHGLASKQLGRLLLKRYLAKTYLEM